MDELINTNNTENLKITIVPLNHDLEISLIRGFEIDEEEGKSYVRNMCVLVQNELVTSTYADTVLFFEELSLFEHGNDQNTYFDITEYKNTKNLKLKNHEKDIFISKSIAKSIYKIYNMSYVGYSLKRLLEFEHRFTIDTLTISLEQNNLLDL